MAEYNPTLKYNRKIYNNWFVRKFVGLSGRLLDISDGLKDKKICGCSLVKYVPSLYRETKGATGSQATRYLILDEIFSGEEFGENDRFIDVGCGKARVLAYLLDNGFKGTLNGIELNKEVAEYAASWANRYDNVNIFQGDAFEHDYNSYDILFLGRPFETEFFKKFVAKLENELTHPIKFYYWVDQQSGNCLNERKGWELHKRKWIFKKNGFYISSCPQRYSIWTYTPSEQI